MKKKLLLISILLLFIKCSKDKDIIQKRPSIYGKWKLEEVNLLNADGKGVWNKQENGYTYIISEDNKFELSRFKECTTGKIRLLKDSFKIVFTFDCEEFSPCSKGLNFCTEKFSFDKNGSLILTPIDNDICLDGCKKSKFKKIQ